MFGAHIPEIIAVLLLGLVFFGPKRLPEIGASLGKGIRDFKKGVSDIQSDVTVHHLPESDSSVHEAAPVRETKAG